MNTISPFKLERYFGQYEFKVKFLLSSSDCESLSLNEVLELATPASHQLWHELRLGYTESSGHPLLRNEVAQLYRNISPDNVVIAAPEEAIFVAMHTLLAPGDHIVTVFPAYQSLYEIARSIGCSVTPWQFVVSETGCRRGMSERGDRFRSLVARAAKAAQRSVAALPGVDRLKSLAGDLRRGVIRIPANGIRAEMVRTDGLESLALAIHDDGVRIEASFENGRSLSFTLVPERALFSPRGPKELVLRAVPDLRGPEVAELAASLGCAVVRAIAGLGTTVEVLPSAIVERDADGTLRVDLRTTSSLRELGQTGRAVLDAIPVRRISCEEDAVLLELGIPIAQGG